jgi:proteasome accessory factor B
MNKAERQLNLAFILLNQRKGVTRNEIRSLIQDYRDATSQSAFERMFERDKDDLKKLGFLIKTSQDTFASSDEIYYRVFADNIFISKDKFTTDEKILLQMALLILQKSELSDGAVERKVESIFNANGIEIDFNDSIRDMANLEIAINAINSNLQCQFSYPHTENDRIDFKVRNVTPIHLVIRNRIYYLISYCHEREDYRVFRLDKIDGAINLTQVDDTKYNKDKVYDLVNLLDKSDSLHRANIRLKTNHSLESFEEAVRFEYFDDDEIEITYRESMTHDLVRYFASNLDKLASIQPSWLRDELMKFLKRKLP